MIYTVFPLKVLHDEFSDEMPQDFSTYSEALAYAEERFETSDEYEISYTTGEVVWFLQFPFCHLAQFIFSFLYVQSIDKRYIIWDRKSVV